VMWSEHPFAINMWDLRKPKLQRDIYIDSAAM